ncbi:MAG: MFS transporter [Candidatus Latescibacteria bacterium]|nr:MFS transporter [Candidatus Latescibacterota bacterium]
MKWRMLAVLALAELLGMTLWFSASAVTPALAAAWQLDSGGQAWLTMSVQIGFVVGTLVSALFNLADIFKARYLFALCALLGAGCNAAIGLWVDSSAPAMVLRFATGVFLAGVYPPGMKIAASWFKEGRGLAIGVLVGGLTVGSAAPHGLRLLGGADWRLVMGWASAAAVMGGLLCLLVVRDGPHMAAGARFDWRAMGRALGDRGVRLANFGYLGHQWELYAVWTWIPLFLAASFTASGVDGAVEWAGLGAFVVIGMGGLGCVGAGLLADRYGRTTITIGSMAISGACCLGVGFLFGGAPLALMAVCLVWGLVIVADSAQFSASISELAEPTYLGTALTLQTCMGFLLTMVSIRLVPLWVEWVTWQWAFVILAIGPVLGSLAMYRLKGLPEAARIGGERR